MGEGAHKWGGGGGRGVLQISSNRDDRMEKNP